MTVGTNPARRGLTLLILSIVPLLMAIVINFPADAGTVSVEVGPTPIVQLDPADAEHIDYEIVIDTGVEVVGYESSISAIAIVATEPTDRTEARPASSD